MRKNGTEKALIVCLILSTGMIQLNPHMDKVFGNLGIICYKMKNYTEAEAVLKKAIAMNSSEPDYFNNLGNGYVERKNYDTAIQCYQKTLSLDPQYNGALHNLAVLYYYKNQYARSWECVRELQKRKYAVSPRLIQLLEQHQ